MIRKVRFSNFYSFFKEQEISFLAQKKKTYDYYQSKSEDQITKVAGFIGGNASGKTNVMRLFSFLSYFVCRKISDDSSLVTDIAYKTFFNNNKKSEFYIEFENKNIIYYYGFSIKENIIMEESLSLKEFKKGAKKQVVFLRRSKKIERLNKKYFRNLSISSFPKIREDVSFVSFMKKTAYDVDIINSVYNYFLSIMTNINEMGDHQNPFHQFRILNKYLDEPTLKKEMEEFISNFDVGLNGFDIKKTDTEKGYKINVQGIHSRKGNNKLDFIYESRGTQSLFYVMGNILSALKNNNVVIIDEIETGFHPDALNKLISYFIDENKSSKAQLIFSSHSLGFMNKLDMHQIYLVEKDNDCASKAFRLNQDKDIRSDENFLAKYMAGAYGAFPKIRV